jgi:bacterioferritin (cytochrome b1)
VTVQSDLNKAVAYCESLAGTYTLMAESTEDKMAKQMFDQMKGELDKHILYLNNRLDYLNLNNELNKKGNP